jgi:hypothetical protein
MEPKSSLPCSQEPSNGPYSEPDQSSPYHPILSLSEPEKDRILLKKLRDFYHLMPVIFHLSWMNRYVGLVSTANVTWKIGRTNKHYTMASVISLSSISDPVFGLTQGKLFIPEKKLHQIRQ